MAAGLARAPNTDGPASTSGRLSGIGDDIAPIRNVLPGIDVMADLTIAGAESPMVMRKNDEARIREGLRKWLDALLFHARVPVGHGDGGSLPFDGPLRTRSHRAISWFRQRETRHLSAQPRKDFTCKKGHMRPI
jgi:hypothetical protein